MKILTEDTKPSKTVDSTEPENVPTNVEETTTIGQSPEEFHRHLREHGRKKLIDFSLNDKLDRKPDWLDEPRFRAAREIVKKYQLG